MVAKSFYLTEEDFEKIKHKCSIQNQGAIGGKLTYQFTPTSIGEVKKIKCACGFEVDVTKYDEW